jgi:hypothetical protein
MRTGTSPKRVATPTRDSKTITRRLAEGESFSEVFALRGGVVHALTTDGWEDIDALTIELIDRKGGTIAPEIDNTDFVLYFIPLVDGTYTVRITIKSLVWGRTSARIKVTLRELRGPSLTAEIA